MTAVPAVHLISPVTSAAAIVTQAQVPVGVFERVRVFPSADTLIILVHAGIQDAVARVSPTRSLPTSASFARVTVFAPVLKDVVVTVAAATVLPA
jgi:hypothetical protein